MDAVRLVDDDLYLDHLVLFVQRWSFSHDELHVVDHVDGLLHDYCREGRLRDGERNPMKGLVGNGVRDCADDVAHDEHSESDDCPGYCDAGFFRHDPSPLSLDLEAEPREV